jgi:predicted RND superfamily exporter protein
MTRIGTLIVDKAIPLTFVCLLVGVCFLFQVPKIGVDNSIHVWLDRHSTEYQEYEEFQREYGSDEWILIAFSVHDTPREQSISDIRAITEDLKGIEHNIDAIAITSAEDPRSQVLRHILLSEDERTVGILLLLPQVEQIENRPALIEKIETVLSPYHNRYSFHLGGPTLLNAELDRTSEYQARLFLTVAFLVTLVGLYCVFRSVFYVFVAVVASGMAVLWTLGIATGFGISLNMITTVLPVLIWVLSLTGSIHFIYHLRRRFTEEVSLNHAISGALQSILLPYAIASLTTAIGFLALLSSHMQPVRDLGLYAAVGIGFGFLNNLILPPGILKLAAKLKFSSFNGKRAPSGDLFLKPSRIRRWKWVISVSGFVLLFLPIFFVSSLRVESNILNFFKPESRILKDYRFISSNLSGLSTIELDFRGQQEDCLDYVSRLTEKLRDIPDIKWTVYPSGQHIRMSIFVQVMESMRFNKLVDNIKSRMASITSEGVRTRLTGTVVLLNRVQEELLNTQIKSLGIALGTIVILLFVIFRSLSVVFIGSIVNLFPISILWGLMVISRIPLNVATVMVASVAIGIAVDDTVFFLVRFRSEFAEGKNWEGAIDRTLIHVVKPITFTSLVTTIGFFVLLLADFKPICFFGLLGGVTMISAWVGDVLILPALLYPFRPRYGGLPR